MSSIQTRKRSDGTTAYRVMFRINGALVGETFEDPAKAEGFRRLVDRVGGREARDVLRARNGDYAGAVLLEAWMADHIDRLTGVTDGTRQGLPVPGYGSTSTRTSVTTPSRRLGRRQLEDWVNTLTPVGVREDTAERPLAAVRRVEPRRV
jgi:hypothetical protein